MKNVMTKAYVSSQIKIEEFAKNNKGTIIEYVLIAAFSAAIMTTFKTEISGLVTDLIATVTAVGSL
ncbi:hypothetical protein NE897_10120 [Yersinia ruckeri]|uniref:hypothetical protein n=1 Tax=Yersinia ruckeri TaxID=29486 RepID=UPI0011A7645E|nr:hypothetical protein [Yersinia ruckeri]EKN3347958.1 hypothetical protein [Yersinia ruckeri]EKN3363177.1 hypothetical protein [Yersinia ruckeri]EKN4202911.1 hypothetical protein [Yersinia ruckeri]EKN4208928.1 hypothetical protein [Yersinia ruckeri]EKN4699431.1 hypothetical protein [Yersinia ruckeri]